MKTEHNCVAHPTRQALSFCHSCGRYFCSDCLVESEEFYYCRDETCQNKLHQEKLRIPSESDEPEGKAGFFKRATKLSRWIWPHITDADSAKKASRQGYWACTLIVGISLLFIVLFLFGELNIHLSILLDVLIFLIIGWGIYKMNRFAAVAGLFFYLFERILIWVEHGEGGPGAMTTLFCLMFVNAVRGTFEYHKYRKESGSTTIA